MHKNCTRGYALYDKRSNRYINDNHVSRFLTADARHAKLFTSEQSAKTYADSFHHDDMELIVHLMEHSIHVTEVK